MSHPSVADSTLAAPTVADPTVADPTGTVTLTLATGSFPRRKDRR